MNLTLRQLSIFSAVATLGSYTKAAESLFLSQPAVSQQIRQLEENLGIGLFDHVGRRLQLTQAGHELLRYARSVKNQLDEAAEVIDALKGIKGGRLDISVASTANHFASRLLAAFSKEHPETQLSLDVTNRRGLLHQLEENSCDMVVMGKPPKALDVEATAFMANPLVIIAPVDHALANQTRIPLKSLEEHSFVLREPDSGTLIALQRFFDEHGLTLTKGMEMTQNEAIKQAVEAGLGLGIVSLHTLELELETGRLCVLDVEGFPVKRDWYVVHRSGKRLSPLAAAFKEFVLAKAGECAKLPGAGDSPPRCA